MNFEAYKVIRDGYIQNQPELFRLDCMNAYKALEELKTTSPAYLMNLPVPEQIAYFYKQHIHFPSDIPLQGTKEGVVKSLETVFQSMSERFPNIEFFLPQDVYPVYFRINQHTHTSTYTTIAEFEFSHQLQEGNHPKLFLMTYPLKPSCYGLDDDLKKDILSWLDSNREHFLIIDGVYTYHFESELTELVRHPRCLWVSSLSKAFLSPKQFGFATMPNEMTFLTFETPSQNDCIEAQQILRCNAALPKEQLQLFQNTWDEIISKHPFLQKYIDNTPSYLKTIPLSFDTLREEYGILAVPASVFGSSLEWSIISCLLPLSDKIKKNK